MPQLHGGLPMCFQRLVELRQQFSGMHKNKEVPFEMPITMAMMTYFLLVLLMGSCGSQK